MPVASDLTVVVRSANERTEGLCHHLICQEAPKDSVIVIHEVPFCAALKRAFEIGLDCRKQWTLCLDADILVAEGAVQGYLEEMSRSTGDEFGVSGFVVDRFYAKPKRRGFNLYRTALLEKALGIIPDAENANRPETFVKQKMAQKGHGWGVVERTCGVHDFEQYYVDIFRKMVVRACKSKDYIATLLSRFGRCSRWETDFLVASWGLHYGRLLSLEQVRLDKNLWKDEFDTVLCCHGFIEKEPLDHNSWSFERVNKAVREHNGLVNVATSNNRLFLSQKFQRGLHQAGKFLCQLGSRMQEF